MIGAADTCRRGRGIARIPTLNVTVDRTLECPLLLEPCNPDDLTVFVFMWSCLRAFLYCHNSYHCTVFVGSYAAVYRFISNPIVDLWPNKQRAVNFKVADLDVRWKRIAQLSEQTHKGLFHKAQNDRTALVNDRISIKGPLWQQCVYCLFWQPIAVQRVVKISSWRLNSIRK